VSISNSAVSDASINSIAQFGARLKAQDLDKAGRWSHSG